MREFILVLLFACLFAFPLGLGEIGVYIGMLAGGFIGSIIAYIIIEIYVKRLIGGPTIPFISTIHRKYGIFLNHNMKDYNLSFGQYPILIRLYDEGPSTQQNLAKIFQLNESTITRALNKLEEKEYIEKHPDYENKRKNYVKVTPKGAKIAKEVMDYDEQWDKICSENLSEKEFEEFKTTLKKIYSTIVKREEK